MLRIVGNKDILQIRSLGAPKGVLCRSVHCNGTIFDGRGEKDSVVFSADVSV